MVEPACEGTVFRAGQLQLLDAREHVILQPRQPGCHTSVFLLDANSAAVVEDKHHGLSYNDEQGGPEQAAAIEIYLDKVSDGKNRG